MFALLYGYRVVLEGWFGAGRDGSRWFAMVVECEVHQMPERSRALVLPGKIKVAWAAEEEQTVQSLPIP